MSCSRRHRDYGERPAKKVARRPVAAAPFASGPQRELWPERVAVVAYGHYQNYGTNDSLLMADNSTGSTISVASPKDLENWASVNQALIPNITTIVCCR